VERVKNNFDNFFNLFLNRFQAIEQTVAISATALLSHPRAITQSIHPQPASQYITAALPQKSAIIVGPGQYRER